MAKEYRTIQGDSFDQIAYRLWKNEHYMRKIMAANPDYMDVLLFEPGVVLQIPDFTPPPKISANLPPWYGESKNA